METPLPRRRSRQARLSERFYNRLWELHLKPHIDEGRTLMDLVEALPESIVPRQGRLALYQAMARRARGDIKRLDTTEEGKA